MATVMVRHPMTLRGGCPRCHVAAVEFSRCFESEQGCFQPIRRTLVLCRHRPKRSWYGVCESFRVTTRAVKPNRLIAAAILLVALLAPPVGQEPTVVSIAKLRTPREVGPTHASRPPRQSPAYALPDSGLGLLGKWRAGRGAFSLAWEFRGERWLEKFQESAPRCHGLVAGGRSSTLCPWREHHEYFVFDNYLILVAERPPRRREAYRFEFRGNSLLLYEIRGAWAGFAPRPRPEVLVRAE